MMTRHWRRIEKSTLYRALKLEARRLTGRELRLRRQVHLPTETHGDWAIVPELLTRTSVVYSAGIGKDLTFDHALIEKWGCDVFAFDPTPSTVAWISDQELGPSFHFRPWAIGGG